MLLVIAMVLKRFTVFHKIALLVLRLALFVAFCFQVHSNEQENRLEIYETIVEIMQPYVDRLIQFMFFQVFVSSFFLWFLEFYIMFLK